MTRFEVLLLFGVGGAVLALLMVAAAISDLRKEIQEIWRRMPRID